MSGSANCGGGVLCYNDYMSATIPQEQLEQWRRLVEAATPGPWKDVILPDEHGRPDRWLIMSASHGEIADSFGIDTADTAFIAAAREAVPALLTEVERLQRELRIERDGTEAVRRESARYRAERDAVEPKLGDCLAEVKRLRAELAEAQ